MKKPPNDIRRNAEGLPLPTRAQIAAAHAYATDLLRDAGNHTRAVPPLHMACALWNLHLHCRRLQEELTAVAAIIARALSSGVLTLQTTADEDEDDEQPASDPAMN